ncbi:MAG: UDP-3-O-(3-hydroxymyristoyl)glucosamine N-acyltransferase [Candidatus Zixiibacteriota bacterium]
MKNTRNRARFTLKELAQRVGGRICGDGKVTITGAAAIETATAQDISFIANDLYLKYLETTGAGAVIVYPKVSSDRPALLRHDNPYLAFAEVLELLYPEEPYLPPGLHSMAIVEDGASVDPTAAIGPWCHVRSGASVGKGSQLVSSVYVGRNVTIGENCLLYPGVRIMDDCRLGNNVIIHSSTVIGSDGFGFAKSETGLRKVKQIGWVEIGDDVEIGSNTSIDRGTLGPTRIGRGTKIDNLVQIAHNVEVGEHCIIVSQVGVSGSTKIGNGVVLAGQVGIVGHVDIGDGVTIGAQSGVSKSVPAGKTVFGYPARDIMETKRIEAALTRLPELLKRVKKLEEKLQ